MSWWGKLSSSSRWTIATLLVFGLLMGLFISTIADMIGYSLSAVMNATSLFHRKAWEIMDGAEPETLYTGKAGNYTYTIDKPVAPTPLSTMAQYISIVLAALITILSTPRYLILVIAITLIIIALEMEVR